MLIPSFEKQLSDILKPAGVSYGSILVAAEIMKKLDAHMTEFSVGIRGAWTKRPKTKWDGEPIKYAPINIIPSLYKGDCHDLLMAVSRD